MQTLARYLALWTNYLVIFQQTFFFLSGFSFTDTDDPQDIRIREGTIFNPLYHFHPLTGIETCICMWDDYHVFLIVTLVFTRLPLDKVYHLVELPFHWLIDGAMFVRLLDELIIGFCYSDLTWKTGGFELALAITLYYKQTE